MQEFAASRLDKTVLDSGILPVSRKHKTFKLTGLFKDAEAKYLKTTAQKVPVSGVILSYFPLI